jgi:hypothetical protein
LGFRVQGSGCKFQGLGFGFTGAETSPPRTRSGTLSDSLPPDRPWIGRETEAGGSCPCWFRALLLEFWVQSFRLEVRGLGCRAEGVEWRVPGQLARCAGGLRERRWVFGARVLAEEGGVSTGGEVTPRRPGSTAVERTWCTEEGHSQTPTFAVKCRVRREQLEIG